MSPLHVKSTSAESRHEGEDSHADDHHGVDHWAGAPGGEGLVGGVGQVPFLLQDGQAWVQQVHRREVQITGR